MTDVDQSVASDSEMAVGKSDCKFFHILRNLFVEIQIIISEALHFRKSHFKTFFLLRIDGGYSHRYFFEYIQKHSHRIKGR